MQQKVVLRTAPSKDDQALAEYVAAIFDTCLYGGRVGNSGRFFIRTRDAGIANQMYERAGGSMSRQGDGVYVWYGSLKDWEFYAEVIKRMKSVERRAKLADLISTRVDKRLTVAKVTAEQPSLLVAAKYLDKLVKHSQELGEDFATKQAEQDPLQLDPEAPNGRYKDGTPRLPFEGKKTFKELTAEERAQYSERLKSRPKIRLAVESLQLIMLLGEKDKHPPELIERARARRKLIQECVLSEGVDACVEKHAPPEFPSWFDFDIDGLLKAK